MTILCGWSVRWTRGIDPQLPVALLTVLPRVVARRDLLWGDVRGLPLHATAERARATLVAAGASDVRLAAATTPIAAEVAARHAPTAVTYVRPGYDRELLAPYPVAVLAPEPPLANLLDGAGVETCRDLAGLTRESVEVRFGATGARLWRLARADDDRVLFAPVPRALPLASLEWTDYALRRAERLVFVLNGLVASVCAALRERGEGAVAVTLHFVLAGGGALEHPLRAARPTASRTVWMRLIRLELDRLVLPDAVTGITLRVDVIGAVGGAQGDVFDRGFGTAPAAEDALGQLLDDGASAVEPENTRHPLLDRRTAWTAMPPGHVLERGRAGRGAGGGSAASPPPALTLQILPVPRRVSVATVPRRGDEVPHAYRDAGATYRIVDVAGPDRVSGERWGDAYAREYFRCVTADGALVWLYRDARVGAWYLHGWWD